MSAFTYVYGVLARPSAPRLARCPEGLPGASRPRALDVGEGLWLIAASAPAPRYSEEAIVRGLRDLEWAGACAAGHERVLAYLHRQGTVVPMRLFTLFHDDEGARAHARAERRRVRRAVERVAGRTEWAVRAVFDERVAKAPAAPRRRPRSGTEFLLARKDVRDAHRAAATRARAEAERLYAALARRVDLASRRPPLAASEAGRHLLLDAAFLVRRADGAAFRRAAREAARRLRGAALDVTVSGPWPPYSFVGGGG